MKPKLIKSRWFPFWCAGFTVYPFIFIRTTVRPWTDMIKDRQRLIRHECIHIWQYRRMGWLQFAWNYLGQLFRVGYRENDYEEEAWAHDETHEEQTLPEDLEAFVQTIV